MKIFEYDKCSTCKKALKFLDQNRVSYRKIPIVETPPTEAELKKMLKFLKGDIKKLFNTSGILYREMGMSAKLKTLSEEEAIHLLAQHGKLIKRPFLLTAQAGLVGFNEAEWTQWLKTC
jgi:arsenate reductase